MTTINPNPNILRCRKRIQRKYRRFEFTSIGKRPSVGGNIQQQANLDNPILQPLRVNESPDIDSSQALTALVLAGCCVCVFFFVIVLAPQLRLAIHMVTPLTEPFIRLVTIDSLRLMLITIIAIYLLSGLVKGMAGIGMGLIAVPVVTIFFGPLTAIAVISVPLIVTNFWQGVVKSSCRPIIASYSTLACCMGISMVICSYYSSLFPTAVFSIVLGLVTIFFVIVNLGTKPRRSAIGSDKVTQCWVGIVSGIIGGTTGLVVIPLVVYLFYSCVNKEKFVSIMGFFLLISGLCLFAGYTLNNTLTADLVMLSCLASLPALFGVVIGENLRQRINEQKFRKFTLVLVGLIGSKILISELIGFTY